MKRILIGPIFQININPFNTTKKILVHNSQIKNSAIYSKQLCLKLKNAVVHISGD